MKIFFAIILFFVSLFAFAQVDLFSTNYSFDRAFQMYEIAAQVHVDNQNRTLFFIDTRSRNFDDVLYNLSNITTVLEIILIENRTTIERSGIQTLVYSYFDAQRARYDILMDRDWLINYYSKSSRERHSIMLELFSMYYNYWFPPSNKQFEPQRRR